MSNTSRCHETPIHNIPTFAVEKKSFMPRKVNTIGAENPNNETKTIGWVFYGCYCDVV